MLYISQIKRKIQQYLTAIGEECSYETLFTQYALLLEQQMLNCKVSGISEQALLPEGKQIIVSLTTYGKRIFEVFLTIESLMQQTIKPNKIILWLSKEQESERIPQSLTLQCNRGLEIKYYKDIRSYKKLIPTLIQYPNDVIITVDDDIVYHYDFIENMVQSYINSPNCIFATIVKEMVLCGKDNIVNYKNWNIRQDCFKSLTNFPIGCGGVIYPPNCFDEEIFNERIFMSLCPFGDDIWFKAMSLKKNILCASVPSGIHQRTFIDNPHWKNKGLTLINIGEGKNDKQIKKVFDYYNLWTFLNK